MIHDQTAKDEHRRVPTPPVGPLPDAMAPDSLANPAHDESIELRLSWRHWALVAVLFLIVTGSLPQVWKRLETFEPAADWRLPTEQTEDYWQYRRWTEAVADQQRILVVGDSVVWGEFAPPSQTLSAQLNRLGTQPLFANGGLKGMPPLALESLSRQVIAGRHQMGCVVHFNPVWMTSPQRDLSENVPTMVNHQLLLPQIWPSIPAYQPDLNLRLGNCVALRTTLFQWVQHVRLEDYEDLDLQRWSLEHPFEWPGQPLDFVSTDPAAAPASQVPPRRVNARPVEYAWVAPQRSLQYQGFLRALEALREQNCPVFCLIGVLNPALQSEPSRRQEQAVREALIQSLDRLQIPYAVQRVEPSWMADSSHPTAAGYQQQARDLWSDAQFQAWLEVLGG